MGMRKAGFAALIALGSLSAVATGFVPKPGSEILKQRTSVYNGELTVLEDEAHGTRFLLAQSRQGLVLQSRIDLSRKQELTMGYFQIMALMTALHPRPEHVFNMGLGGGALPRFHLGRYPKSQIVSAEIDAGVIDLAQQFFFVSDARHRIVEGDAFEVLKNQPSKYDVVWVDTASPKEGPRAYIQAKYLNVLREHLSDQGLIVANLGDSKSPESFAGVERGYRQGYARGIRVKSPLPLGDETPDAILSLLKAGRGELAPAMKPSFFVAVGNQKNLDCATFLKIYKKWHAAKEVGIGWDVPDSEVCADL